MKYSRRSFLAGIMGAAVGNTIAPQKSEAAMGSVDDSSYATLIDLTKCDGCVNKGGPRCVEACRDENAHKFPEPDKDKIKDYWPQKKHEDWSDKRDVRDRLTPYNWTFVQKVEVEHDGQTQTVHVPRRCMHCDSPACVKLCPFGSMKKDKNGPVHVDTDTCFGGAKCRTVCPWDVPQRQSGVGIYTYLQPLPVGGGVMYKCDLCKDRLLKGEQPACVPACPQKALSIGRRKEIFSKVERLKAEHGMHVYGINENGGTSTIYVSAVPFEKIDNAIVASAKNPKKVMRINSVDSKLEASSGLTLTALAAPVIGAIGGFAMAAATSNKKKTKEADNE